MNSKETLTEFEKIISADSYRKEFCDSAIAWIGNRRHDWVNGQLRLGVIGVTSSGKSTLINAIIADDLLACAVAPSSGQLVSCCYGDSAKCVISFEDGREIILQEKLLNQQNLKEYSDERYNPRNEKNVRSIELSSPSFDLGKNVSLIDSPGLDAFGLEAHEKLTLQSLVPTLDACIYVTTMKANSDRKTKDILDVIAKYNCPVIVVQNMLDSVRQSPGGDKSSAQVAREHLERVKKIINTSDLKDKKLSVVVQMSAQWAKSYRTAKPNLRNGQLRQNFDKSGYAEFVGEVERMLGIKRPQIEYQRLHSVSQEALQLLAAVDEAVVNATEENTVFSAGSNIARSNIEEQFRYEGQKNSLNGMLQRVEEKFKEIRKHYSDKKEEFINRGNDIGNDSGESDAEQFINEVNNLVSFFGDGLLTLMSGCTDEVISIADDIHIPNRDILSPDAFNRFPDLEPKKTKTYVPVKVKVQQSGLWGEVKRFFGGLTDNPDWGYDEKTEIVKKIEIDYERTKESAFKRLSEAASVYTQTVEQWLKRSLVPAIDKLLKEIDKKEENYNKRKQMKIKTDALRKLSDDLRIFCRTLDEILKKHAQSGPSDQERDFGGKVHGTVFMDVEDYSVSVIKLSESALQSQHRATLQAMVEYLGCTNAKAVIAGWDKQSIDEFRWQTGIQDAVVVLNPTAKELRNCSQGQCCFFILVDTTKIGAAMKQLKELELEHTIVSENCLVWVVQDLQELLNAGSGAEGVSEMLRLSKRLNLPNQRLIYLMHKNPIYNIGFLMYQTESKFAGELHVFVKKLQDDFKEYTSPEIEKTLSHIVLTASGGEKNDF